MTRLPVEMLAPALPAERESTRHPDIRPSSVVSRIDALPNHGARHLDYVDAVRGWAFLLVLLCHVGNHVDHLPAKWSKLAAGGIYGVQLFFVASAFTLALSLQERGRAERRPLLSFFVRRLFRIGPAFWAAILVYVCWYRRAPSHFAPLGVRWVDIFSSATFLHGWHPLTLNSVIPGQWSIGVEMSFYLLVPWLVRWCKTRERTVLFILASLVFSVLTNRVADHVFNHIYHYPANTLVSNLTSLWLPVQLPVFGFGFLLYQTLMGAGGVKSERYRSITLLLSAAYLAAITLGVSGLFPARFVAGAACFCFIWALAVNPLPLLVNPVTRFVGKVSYSAYLTHFLVLDVFSGIAKSTGHSPSGLLALPFVYLIAGTATVAVAWVSFIAVEEPGRLLGKAIVKRLNR